MNTVNNIINVKSYKEVYKNYLCAKELSDRMNSIYDRLEQEILDENVFVYNTDLETTINGQRMTKPFDTYMLSKADFKKYLDILHKKWIIHNPNHEYGTNAYIYTKMLHDAEDKIINWGIEILPKIDNLTPELFKKMKSDNKTRKEMLKLILDLIENTYKT